MGTYYCTSSDVWLGVKTKSSNSRFISYNFTQTMEKKFQRIMNVKTGDMNFAEVTFTIC